MLSSAPLAAHAESNEDLAAEIRALKAQIREMKTAISATRAETRKTAAKVRGTKYAAAPAPAAVPYALPPGAIPVFVTADKKFSAGGITITPGGFIAAESVYRTRATGSDLGTPFGSIPFPNNSAARTNEWRASARQTRLALLVEGAISPTAIAAGYVETDFYGAAPTANNNQTNSYTPRLRHAYVTLDENAYGMHVLAGQNWSLITLNTKGITPRNELTPAVIDLNQNVGSIYARQAQIRLTKDFDKKLWLSVSAEASQTPGCASTATNGGGAAIAGTGGFTNPADGSTITSTTCGVTGQTGNWSGQTYSLNHVPDVIGKAAYEATIADRAVHFEAYGMYTDLYNRVSGTTASGTPFQTNKDTTGFGVGGGIVAQIFPKRLDFQIQGTYGRGIGRYGASGLTTATMNPDGSLKAVPEFIGLTGVTFHATPAIDIYGYAGLEQVQSTYFTTAAGGYVGLGTPATPSNAACYTEGGACAAPTKSVFELTGGFWDKLYKGSFGEVRAGIQYSYIQRQLFNATTTGTAAGTGQPGFRTQEHEIFTSLRYYPFQ